MFWGFGSQVILFLVSNLPLACVLLFGAYLCVRHRRHKRRQSIIVGVALGLLVLSNVVPYLVWPVFRSLGIKPGIDTTSMTIFLIACSVPGTSAIALLIWAVFGNFGPHEEPVFRFDDEREADTK